ncbi:MAG: DUF1036 domain-containing protein [Pseudomonadota bacterium]
MRFLCQIFLVTAFTGVAGSASAALRICNETSFVQSVTIGYEGTEGWQSKGWWNIDPNDCAVVVGGDLQQRFYYYRAEVNGGDFPGGGYTFCTVPREFEIIGDTNCEARGYEAEEFAEIDTGASASDFTFTLVSSDATPPPRNEEGPGQDTDQLGLNICNQTNDVQSVTIGYESGDQYKSEGWWNIDPDDCALVLAGELQERYYYYRAEVNAGPFEGEGFMFCTSPEIFEIFGDTNCEARGYDTESFTEIDTGPTARGHTVFITADGNAPPPQNDIPPPPPPGGNGGIEVCNEGSVLQSVAFGYEGPDGWTSEGWWNVDPGECVVPALDGVNRRYLYYTAIGEGIEMTGEGYYFCSSNKAFVVTGDSDCEARGYERSLFKEVDTGGTSGMYTLVVVDGGGGKSPDNTGGKDSDGKPGGGGTINVDETPRPEVINDNNGGGNRINDDDTPSEPTFDFDLPDNDNDSGPDVAPDTVTEDDSPAPEPDNEPDQDTVETTPDVDEPPASEETNRPPRRGGSRGD